MRGRVLGVVRSADRLAALTYEARTPTTRGCPWMGDQVCELRPLAASARPELWSAWRALASVTRWDDATLAHVLVVLRETVPCGEVAPDPPALGAEVRAPTAPRATAAHPRAYRGTKHRPPRPARPDAVDVRPYLLSRRHIDQVLEQLGYPRGLDPYVAWNHRADTSAGLDPGFVMQLLPVFRGCTWSEVGAFASLARTLELSARRELRAALVGVYLVADDPQRALGWWTHVLGHDLERRLEAAKLVGTSEVAKLPTIDAATGALVAALPPVQQWSFYRGLVGGASPAYLASGLALGALSAANIDHLPAGRADVTAVVEATVGRLGEALDGDGGAEHGRRHLWRLCGDQPELIALLASRELATLIPEAALGLLRIASHPQWHPETVAARWRALAPQLPRLVELVAQVAPEYQRKLVEDIGAVYEWASAEEHDLADVFARCLALGVRIAKPPFGTDARIGGLLPTMTLIYQDASHDADRRAIRDAPDASWGALEARCKRDNQVRLLGRGLNRLAQFAPALLASTFAATPAALLATADLVAALSFEAAETILETYAKSPLADRSLADATIERLCEVVAPVARAGGPNPVRRALREHLAGESVLSTAQLRGHRARVVAELGIIRLAAVRQAVERALAARVGIGVEMLDRDTVRHALAIFNEVDVHRRPLRRMLAAAVTGDRTWTLRHPRTREWFARHPRLDREAWLAGVETRGELPDVGDVRIAIETDPLEALKLGTYVSSCLGRGGNLEYAAAAVVLDVNKHVVYARDRRGSVVARQLIAISEADELVCFEVYGACNKNAIQPLFRAFDRAFAAKLAISVFDGGREYEIASILSRRWWDDGAWVED